MDRKNQNVNVKDKHEVISMVTVNVSPLHKCFGRPGTPRARRSQMVKLFVLTLLPGVMLIVQNGIFLRNSKKLSDEKRVAKDNVLLSIEIGQVIHRTQIERGTSVLYLASHGSTIAHTRVLNAYVNTDAAIGKLRKWVTSSEPAYFESKSSYHDHIKKFRSDFDITNYTFDDIVHFYTNDNAKLIEMVAAVNQQGGGFEAWPSLVAYHMLIISKDYSGIERALGGAFFAKGYFSPKDFVWYVKIRTLGNDFLNQAIAYSSHVKNLHQELYVDSALSDTIQMMREVITDNSTTDVSVFAGTLWFDNMTDYIDILLRIERELAFDIVQQMDGIISSYEDTVVVSALEMTGVLVLVPFVVFLVVKATRQIQDFAEGLQLKTIEFDRERRRTEQLLFEILPKSVAIKLMNKERIIPEVFSSVTVLFTDIVGFTDISGRSTPIQVIDMLNKLYLTFDLTIEKCDAYKVETIGDGYMVASGLPQRNGDRHVLEIAGLALEMLQQLHKIEIPHLKEEKLKLRLGFNTGPVVTGVVGTKMPRYCIFGDTVNTASRMESTSKPCMIQASETSGEKLLKIGGFNIKERGEIYIKGKGMMRTYWLLGRENDPNMTSHDVSPPSSIATTPTHPI